MMRSSSLPRQVSVVRISFLRDQEEEEKADDPANAIREKRIHPLKIPQNELQANMHQREYGKGITERFVNYVPEVEHFL